MLARLFLKRFLENRPKHKIVGVGARHVPWDDVYSQIPRCDATTHFHLYAVLDVDWDTSHIGWVEAEATFDCARKNTVAEIML